MVAKVGISAALGAFFGALSALLSVSILEALFSDYVGYSVENTLFSLLFLLPIGIVLGSVGAILFGILAVKKSWKDQLLSPALLSSLLFVFIPASALLISEQVSTQDTFERIEDEKKIAENWDGQQVMQGFWLPGIDLSGLDRANADFSNANLSDANLGRTNLSGAILRDANLRRANLYSANLTDASLSNANLSISDLRGADLVGADLRNADMEDSDLSRANLRGADMIGAYMLSANLTLTNLEKADLTRVTLRNADLTRANLRNADLIESNLVNANLTEAKLGGTDLRGALLEDQRGEQLEEACFDGAKYTSDTIWPEDFDPEAAGAILVDDAGEPVGVSE
jgi:uncharacterized protein YjbI with pentapeptide repeats